MEMVWSLDVWSWKILLKCEGRIFILEGLLTVVVACISFFVLYDFPETASFLSEEERAWVVHRLKYQGSRDSGKLVAESNHFEWRHVKQAFSDPQILIALFSKYLWEEQSEWLGRTKLNFVAVYWGIVCPLYG